MSTLNVRAENRSLQRSGPHSGQWLSISEAASLVGVSPSSLRNFEAAGELEGAVVRTPLGGHRRYDPRALRAAFGIETEECRESKSIHSAIYARVSTQKQKDDGSLERQIQRMKEFVREQGLEESECIIFADCASAFGGRDQLNRLVSDVLSGSIRTVYTEHLDRISRTGSERRLLEFLFDSHGVELVCAREAITDTTEQSYFLEEVISYMTVVCNRVSSHKARKVCETKFENQEELLRAAEELLGQGLGLWNVVKKLNADGWTCTVKGRERPLNYTTIRKLLIGRNAVRESLSQRDIIGDFLKESCVIGTGQVPVATLFKRYVSWCRSKGFEPATKYSFATRVRKDFKSQTIRLNPKQTCCGYVGLSLKTQG